MNILIYLKQNARLYCYWHSFNCIIVFFIIWRNVFFFFIFFYFTYPVSDGLKRCGTNLHILVIFLAGCPQSKIISEQLHDKGGIFIRFFRQGI